MKMRDPYFLFAILLTIANVALVWAFRFLPLYDYPIWLYEVHVMREIADPTFLRWFEVGALPVPNLGLVGVVYLLSFVFSIETAGKIFLTLCVVGLPWSFRYSILAMNEGKPSWAEYAAFPFSFCIIFFAGQAFFFGLVLLFLAIGFLHSRQQRESSTLSVALVVIVLYFVHAIVAMLAILVFFGYAMNSQSRRRSLLQLGMAIVPTVACAIAYQMMVRIPDASEARWSLWILAQNIFKSFFIVTRSYGHEQVFPPTLLNGSWTVALAATLWISFRRSPSQQNKQFLFPLIISAILMFSLPAIFLGVVQPGARFGLPFILFTSCFTARAQLRQAVKYAPLAIAAVIVLYNVFHFGRVNERMTQLYSDFQANTDASGTFAVVRFDWPSERNWYEVGASSIDPMFGAPYYSAIRERHVAGIFGTALLKQRSFVPELRPVFNGATREEFTASLIANRNRFDCFRYLILVGKNRELEQFSSAMSETGFVLAKKSEFWTIMTATRKTDFPQ